MEAAGGQHYLLQYKTFDWELQEEKEMKSYKKQSAPVPKGFHKMPGGSLMRNEDKHQPLPGAKNG